MAAAAARTPRSPPRSGRAGPLPSALRGDGPARGRRLRVAPHRAHPGVLPPSAGSAGAAALCTATAALSHQLTACHRLISPRVILEKWRFSPKSIPSSTSRGPALACGRAGLFPFPKFGLSVEICRPKGMEDNQTNPPKAINGRVLFRQASGLQEERAAHQEPSGRGALAVVLNGTPPLLSEVTTSTGVTNS
ncbi:unnamed protein product [Coccothraustes coccothraustes]